MTSTSTKTSSPPRSSTSRGETTRPSTPRASQTAGSSTGSTATPPNRSSCTSPAPAWTCSPCRGPRRTSGRRRRRKLRSTARRTASCPLQTAPSSACSAGTGPSAKRPTGAPNASSGSLPTTTSAVGPRMPRARECRPRPSCCSTSASRRRPTRRQRPRSFSDRPTSPQTARRSPWRKRSPSRASLRRLRRTRSTSPCSSEA